MIKKHFVNFMSPGTFVAEQTTLEINDWNIDKAVKISKDITERYGAKPYGFYFTTKGGKDDELDSKTIEKSGMYYLNGEVKTLEEIKAENNPDNRILISNMECNKWDRVVTTCSPYKWTQPLEKNDVVLKVG